MLKRCVPGWTLGIDSRILEVSRTSPNTSGLKGVQTVFLQNRCDVMLQCMDTGTKSSAALHADANILHEAIWDHDYLHSHQFVRTLVQTRCWCDDKLFVPVKAQVVKGWLKMCRLSIYSAERADPAALSLLRVRLLQQGRESSRDAKTHLNLPAPLHLKDALKMYKKNPRMQQQICPWA